MKEKIDLLIQKITQNQDSNDILEARKEYQKLAGEIYEDDRTYETRMGLFLEWYIFDHTVPGKEKSPLELFFDQNGVGGTSPRHAEPQPSDPLGTWGQTYTGHSYRHPQHSRRDLRLL